MKRKTLLLLMVTLITILSLTLGACSLFGGDGEQPEFPPGHEDIGPGGDGYPGEHGDPGDIYDPNDPENHWSDVHYNLMKEESEEMFANKYYCIARRYNKMTNESQEARADVTIVYDVKPTFDTSGTGKYIAVFAEKWAGTYEQKEHFPKYELFYQPPRKPTFYEEGNIGCFFGSDGKYYTTKAHDVEISRSEAIIPKIVPTFVEEVESGYGVKKCAAHYEYDGDWFDKKVDEFNNTRYILIENHESIMGEELPGKVKVYAYGVLEKETSHLKDVQVQVKNQLNQVVSNDCYDAKFYSKETLEESSLITDLDKYIKDNEIANIYVKYLYKVSLGNADHIVVAYNEPLGTLPIPAAKDGFNFVGWKVKKISNDCLKPTDKYNLKNNCTGDAVWIDSGLEFKAINDTETELISYTGNQQTVDIPEKVDGKTIVKIADNAFNPSHVDNTIIQRVNMPNTIKEIGNYALYGLVNATFNMSNQIEKIGDYACYGSIVYNVKFPSTLISIGQYAFANSSQLTEIYFDNGVNKISNFAFADCVSLKEFEIQNSLVEFGIGVLSGCTNLQQINSLSDIFIASNMNVYYIGTKNYNTDPLGEAKKVYSIKSNELLFAKDYSTLPQDVVIIGPYAYYKTDNTDKEVMIKRNIIEIGDHAFDNANINEYNLKFEETPAKQIDEPLIIGEYAFYNNSFRNFEPTIRLIGTLYENTLSNNSAESLYINLSNTKLTHVDRHIAENCPMLYVNLCNNSNPFTFTIDPLAFENNILSGFVGPFTYFNTINKTHIRNVGLFNDDETKYETITVDTFKDCVNLRTISLSGNFIMEDGALHDYKLSHFELWYDDCIYHPETKLIASDNFMVGHVDEYVETLHLPTKAFELVYPELHKNWQLGFGLKNVRLRGNGSPKFNGLTSLTGVILEDGYFTNVEFEDNYFFNGLSCYGIVKFKHPDPFRKNMGRDDSNKLNVHFSYSKTAFELINGFSLEDNNEYQKIWYNTVASEGIDDNYYITVNDKIIMVTSQNPVIPATVNGKNIDVYLAYMGTYKYAPYNYTLDVNLKKIPDYMFYQNTMIQSIEFNGQTEIGVHAFDGCPHLTNVTLPDTLVKIGDYAFNNSVFTSIEIPSGVSIVGESAFANNSKLTTVTTNHTQEYTKTNWNANWSSGIVGNIIYLP